MKIKLNIRIVAAVLAVSALSFSHFALAVNTDGGGGGGGGLPPTATLSASPTSITAGAPVTLTWSSTRATSGCVGTNFTSSGTSGSATVNPTVTTTYSITCNNANGSAAASATVTVTVPATIDLTAGGVTPTAATTGAAVTLTATVSNIGAASTGAGFTNLFQRATDASGTGATDIGTHTATVLAGSGSVAATLSYTFPSAATWYVRACADKNSAASTGTITESNEANNCGVWTAVVVSTPVVPTVTISATPSSLTSGQTSTLTWSAANATTCTGTNFATGNQVSGTVSVSPTTSTTYSISCTGAGGTGTASATITVASGPTVTHYNNKLCSGGTLVGTYTDNVNSCVSFCTGMSASCCSTSETYRDIDGSDTFVCQAYTNTATTITANGTTQCQNQSGEPVCTNRWYSADLINYGPAVSASLVTNPTSMSGGQSAVITWSSTNATTCTGTNFATGNATSGSVTVSPSGTTQYTLSCTGPGGTATDTKTITVNIFTASCSAAPSPVTVLQPVSWTSSATGGTGSYTYAWSGTDSLSGTASSLTKSYSTLGEKFATLSVTSGATTISVACNGTPCQTSSCTCSAPGCGVVVQEGVSADVTASIPTIASGALAPGGFLNFAANIQNIGNNSISSVFQNRFQVDIGADGAYDVNLDTGGTAGSQFTLEYGKTCSTGSIVATDSYQIYGSGDLDSTINSLCQADATSGQCCGAVVTTGNTGGGGGGGGGGGYNAKLVQRFVRAPLAAAYKSLAVTYYDVAITVYSSPTKSNCPVGQTCYAGTWQPQAGSLYSIPYNTWLDVTSPQWSNIPLGTHKVRLCTDIPSSQLVESNENNNCGPDFTFTISGYDLTGGASGVNTGSLIGGQSVTFFGNVVNSPPSYVASGQCQATVVVSGGVSCSIAVNRDQLVWSTTGATMVTNIDPLTTSPTVPPTGTGGNITQNYTETQVYNSSAVIADMQANGGINLPAIQNGSGFAGEQITMNRACVDLTGNAAATAATWGGRGYNSCGNNSILRFNGTIWTRTGACSFNNHLSASLTCQYPGSPYGLSGTYVFPSELGVGTHTYRLTDNAATNNTCQASITIPANSSGGLCTLTATPSIVASGGSSILSWITNGASSFSIDQGIGNVASSTGASCLPAGEEIPAGGLCNESTNTTIQWGACCSGTARFHCFANEPGEAYCWGGGAGQSNSVTVNPTVTTTYTGTATTDSSKYAFTGCAPSQFQVDTNNDGTWDSTIASAQCLTSLGVNQTTQSVSQPWTAIPGSHRVRICVNTPPSGSEGDTTNNCGPAYTFAVSNPVQCSDGIDNNGNGLIDTADPACTSGGDVSEETHPAAVLTLSSPKSTVKKGTTTTLTWSGTDVVSGSCKITSSAGDSWTLIGTSGTQTTAAITSETTYTLSCTSQQSGTATTVTKSIKLAPIFEEV